MKYTYEKLSEQQEEQLNILRLAYKKIVVGEFLGYNVASCKSEYNSDYITERIIIDLEGSFSFNVRFDNILKLNDCRNEEYLIDLGNSYKGINEKAYFKYEGKEFIGEGIENNILGNKILEVIFPKDYKYSATKTLNNMLVVFTDNKEITEYSKEYNTLSERLTYKKFVVFDIINMKEVVNLENLDVKYNDSTSLLKLSYEILEGNKRKAYTILGKTNNGEYKPLGDSSISEIVSAEVTPELLESLYGNVTKIKHKRYKYSVVNKSGKTEYLNKLGIEY